MDMLFQKYACPFLFLEQILQVGRFPEFVDEFLKMHNEDVQDETMWQLYLHSAFLSETFEAFKSRCVVPNVAEQPKVKVNLEATVKESMNILDGFVPE